MTPQQFVAKWKKANLSERSACQQHFLDRCEVLAQPKPAAADPDGAFYTFERGVNKTGGGKVVCDLDLFEIHTNFTGTAKKVYAFDLDALAEPAHLDTLRKLFIDPDALKPLTTTRGITEQAAERFGMLADGMRQRGVPIGPPSDY